jgi:ribosome maturation factor RimP
MIVDKEIEEKIKGKVREFLERENLCLVEFRLLPHGKAAVVRVVVDYPGGGITIDDCARLNRAIFSYLDREDILGETFSVEVVSPGLHKPLKVKDDFLRVKGRRICVWLKTPLNDKTYLEGKVLEADETKVILEEKEIIEVPLEIIKFAKQKIG